MALRKEMRTETVEHEVVFIQCDICKKEVGAEFPVHGFDFQAAADQLSNRAWWWRKPLDKIVGIKKGSIRDEKNADFDVHVKCAYEAIKKAVQA